MTKRLILSNSFTIEQVKDVLDLITALNLNKSPAKILRREGIGRVFQKFVGMERKHSLAVYGKDKTRAHRYRRKGFTT